MIKRYTRHQELPVYRFQRGIVPAKTFNTVSLGLIRLRAPLRLTLTGLKHLDVILQQDAWIIVDNSLNDVPVIAWTDFDRKRDNLHRPVLCQIRLFHIDADKILVPSLALIQSEVILALRSASLGRQ